MGLLTDFHISLVLEKRLIFDKKQAIRRRYGKGDIINAVERKMQKILRINMTAMSARYEDVPGEFIRLGASYHKKIG